MKGNTMDSENIDSNNLEMNSPIKKKRKTRSSRHLQLPISQSLKCPETVVTKNGCKRNSDESVPSITKYLKTYNESYEDTAEIDMLALRLKSNVTTDDGTTANQIGSNLSEANTSNKSQNFITTLQKVSTQKYSDVRSRLKILTLPECCHNKARCENIHNNSEVHMISSYEKEAFKINFKSGLWDEALIVCHHTLNKNHSLSAEVLLSIMEIILNVHYDGHKDYSCQYIIQGFEKIIQRLFVIHPPCSDRIIKNYRNFLTEPLVFESIIPDRELNKPKLGLFKFILSRLEYELRVDSPDGPIIDADIEKFDDNLNEVYMRKRKYEIYETHNREQRITRLFIVLDIIVELLEKDLAIWITKYIDNPSRYVSGTKKPLTASLLWQNNTILTGVVTDNCRQIFRMYKNLVKLNFPLSNIKTFSRLVAVFSNTFYICDKNCNIEYPFIGNCCIILADEFYKIIEEEDVSLVISIIAKANTTFLQFLLTKRIVKSTMKSDYDDFILSIDDIFKHQNWNNFSDIDISTVHSQSIFCKNEINPKGRLCKPEEGIWLKTIEQYATKQTSALNDLRKTLKKHDTDYFYSNTFAKLWTEDKLSSSVMPVNFGHLEEHKGDNFQANINNLNKSEFVIVFYLSFKFFLELYSIDDIKKYYKVNFETIPKAEKKIKPGFDKDVNHNLSKVHDKPEAISVSELKLSAKCIKEYVLIFKTMKKIGNTYEDLAKKNLLPTNIFDNLKFFPRK